MKRLVEFIKKHKSFLITSHIDPEGDSLGSLIALAELLKQLKKKVFVLCDSKIPKAYDFMAPYIKFSDPKKVASYEAAIIVDAPKLGRIGRVQDLIDKDKPIAIIDHHIPEEKLTDITFIDEKASSAGELLYRLYKEMGLKSNAAARFGMYVAIATDTGSFQYSNSTPSAHIAAAEFIKEGIQPKEIANLLYARRELSQLKLLSMALATLSLLKGGRIASLYITKDMMRRAKSTPNAWEHFIDYARSIKGVSVAVFFKEIPGGSIKVSFRSKDGMDMNKVAKVFGGGGHKAASGCEVKGSLKAVMRKVLKVASRGLSPKGTVPMSVKL